MAEAATKKYSEHLMTTATYMELKPGSSKGSICIRKQSDKPVTLPSQTINGTVSAAKLSLLCWHQRPW